MQPHLFGCSYLLYVREKGITGAKVTTNVFCKRGSKFVINFSLMVRSFQLLIYEWNQHFRFLGIIVIAFAIFLFQIFIKLRCVVK